MRSDMMNNFVMLKERIGTGVSGMQNPEMHKPR